MKSFKYIGIHTIITSYGETMIKKAFPIKLFGILIMISMLLIIPSSNITASPVVATTSAPVSFQDGQWDVTTQDQLVYNINTVNNGTAHYFNMTQGSSNQYIGSLVQGNSFVFAITSLPNLAVNNVVQGYITGKNLTQNLNINYPLATPDTANINATNGPPYVYFVTPVLNKTQYGNFTQQEYVNHFFNSTLNTSSLCGLYYTNTITSTTFNITWSKNTGIMQYYYFNGTDSHDNIVTLELTFVEDFNPNVYNPHFGLIKPVISYNFTKIDLFNNGTTQIPLYGDYNTYQGYFAQGQIAIVNVYNESFTNQPSYSANIGTATGYVNFQGFNESGSAPPFLEFLFPVSTNTSFWNVIGIYFGAMGLHQLVNNATTFGLGNLGQLEVYFNKSNGLMESYFVNMTFGSNTNVRGIMKISLISFSDMNTWNPSWGIANGTINQYFIKTLNNRGNHTIQGDQGSIKEGQNTTITINSLSSDFSSTLVNMTTTTGAVSLDQFLTFLPLIVNTDTPQLFFPVIPKESTGQAYSFLSSTFSAMGAIIVNNATVFQVQLVNKHIDNYLVNININWNKTSGVLLYYHYTVVNTLNSSDILDFELIFMGQVSHAIQPSLALPLSSTPGFEFIWAIIGILAIALPVTLRKRKF